MLMWTRNAGARRGGGNGGLIAALDVGTTKVCCFLARVAADRSIHVVGIGHHLSRGVKGGAVVDMNASESSVRAAVDAAERMAGEVVREAYVSLSAGRQASQSVGIEVPVTANQVRDADIRRAVHEAVLRCQTDGREVIHALPLQYSIDGATGIRDPRGMFGARLGAHVNVVTAGASEARNLAVCVGRGHLETIGPVASGYASGLATLVEDEAELGATVVDMGGGITSVSVFAEGAPVLVDSVPLGGQHVTNDIARGLGTTAAHAERMKTLYGAAVESPSDEREMIEVPPVGESAPAGAHHVPRSELVRIIRPRIEELFELVGERLRGAGAEHVAGRRMVLTGGASQLDGVAEAAGSILDKQVRIGRPIHVQRLAESTGGPAFATCAGILTYAASPVAEHDAGAVGGADKGGSALVRMGRWLRENL